MSNAYAKSFIKDNGIIIFGNVLNYMKSIILMPLLIKTVGVTIYGGFVLFVSLLGIVIGVSSLGAGFRAQRFLPSTVDRTARHALFFPQFYFQFASILCLSLILILLCIPIDKYIFKGAVSYHILVIPVYLVCIFLFAQSTNYFRYTSRILYMTVGGILFAFLDIAFILAYFYLVGYLSINILVLSQALSGLIIAAPCLWLIYKEIGIRPSFYKNIRDLISDIKIGFPLVVNYLIDFVLAGSDRYLIAFYMTVSAVGYYNPGYTLGSLILFIPKAMGGAMPQLLARAVDSNSDDEGKRMLNYAIKFFLLAAIPFIFGCIVLSRPILTLLANEEVARNAYLVTPVVALGALFYGLNQILSNVLFVRFKTDKLAKMNFFASFISVTLNFILIYFFRNIIVAAITSLVSFFMAFIYISGVVRRDGWHIDFQPVTIVKSISAAILMCLVLSGFSTLFDSISRIGFVLIAVMIGIAAYTCGLFILGTFSRKELQFVRSCFPGSGKAL